MAMAQIDEKSYTAFLSTRRDELMSRIASAATRSGRDSSEVRLVAISKTVDVPQMVMAHEVGYDCFGENRPQELFRKTMALKDVEGITFHMVGNLQTNKINKVLGCATLIHSITSQHLADAVASRAQARDIDVHCLLEVNVSGEASKSGATPTDALLVAQHISELDHICLDGLMSMAPAGNKDSARRTFSGLRELRDKLKVSVGLELPVLSCGMSDDFEIAIEEGSTLVRLGRIVFDPSYNDAATMR